VDTNGNIHAVIPTYEAASLLVPPVLQPAGGYAPLVQVKPNTGEIMSTVLDNAVAPSFDVPLSLAFGTLEGDRTTVFITNGALSAAQGVPGPGPRIIQVGIGVPGFLTVPEPSAPGLIAGVLLVMSRGPRKNQTHLSRPQTPAAAFRGSLCKNLRSHGTSPMRSSVNR
jgi:hypothetical protein